MENYSNLFANAAGRAWTAASHFLGGEFNYADANSTISTSNLAWRIRCWKDAKSWFFNPLSPSSAFHATATCLGLDQTADNLNKFIQTTLLNASKNSLKKVASAFFTLCPPLSFTLPAPNASAPLNYIALATIALLSTVFYRASLEVDTPRMEKLRDYSLLGTTVGTTLSWLFDQNLYLGASCGLIAGVAAGFVRSCLPFYAQIDWNFLQNHLNPFTHQRWDLIVPGTISLVTASAFSNFDPEAGKEIISFVGVGTFITTYFLFDRFLLPVARQMGRIGQFASENLPPILSLGWMSMVLSRAVEEISSRASANSLETRPFEND